MPYVEPEPDMPVSYTPSYRKEIVYDREARDYALYLDSELIGFARTYGEADTTLDTLVSALVSHKVAGAVDATDDPGENDPGDDCPEHGPYADDDCPKCEGTGRIPNFAATGALDGGYSDPCDTCHACKGRHVTQRCPTIRELLFAPLDPSIQTAMDRLKAIKLAA